MTDVTNSGVVPSTYHHGDLRAAVLSAAAEAVQRDGPQAVNLRALAREAGVSHTAPRHHFGDRRGVLTALATQGYAELAGRLDAAGAAGDFLEVGVAFVAFALERPAHFQVLFRPDLVDVEDPELCRARARLSAQLAGGAQRFAPGSSPEDPHTTTETPPMRAQAATTEPPSAGARFTSTGLAAWSMAYGFASLALSGALNPAPGEDLLDLARRTLRHLAPE